MFNEESVLNAVLIKKLSKIKVWGGNLIQKKKM